MNFRELNNLIQNQTKECDWLDYKQTWPNNKVDLLRDILSFVNTTHDKDCFLIFGIKDKTFEIIGVGEDKNRKNTQQVLDFLSRKNLSTGIPEVTVDTIIIENKEVDILTIKDTRQVPVFLEKEFSDDRKKCTAGQIFTRIGDTNTAIDTTANIFVVEKLMKKRLMLDSSIIDRYSYLLEQVSEWTFMDSEQKLIFNFDPNFYILITPYDEEDEQRRVTTGDYYSWLVEPSIFPMDRRINQYNSVSFMYGNHKIFEIGSLIYFDRFRGVTPVPKVSKLIPQNRDYLYHYFLKDSLEMKFMTLFSESWNNCMSEQFYENFYSTKLIFDNVVIYENLDEKNNVEKNYDFNSTIEMVERDCDYKIIPTEEEILEFENENSEFTRKSLIRNNIAKALNKKLKEIR